MHVGTHFFAGWLVSAMPGLTRGQRAAIALAGVAPDLDGVGLVAEFLTQDSARPLLWYSDYHHVLGHNIGFALVVTAVTYALTHNRLVAVLAFASFHLHLLFDLAGSRGADGHQWPIPYLQPFSSVWQMTWSGQWFLGAWQNTAITAVLLMATVVVTWRFGYSPVGLISPRGDAVFVNALRGRFGAPHGAT